MQPPVIGIYSITHRDSGKRYIGKSRNIHARWWNHRYAMSKDERTKDCNRHLWNAAHKHGLDAFSFDVLETFACLDEEVLRDRELFWMDHYCSYKRSHGYNLRRDSSTQMLVHQETLRLMSEAVSGENNPNFGNLWTDEQKNRMSNIAKGRHASGCYGQAWRDKIGKNSVNQWADTSRRHAMANSVKLAKRKYNFEQYFKDGSFVRLWSSVEDVIAANPTWKWQNIYSVCNGYKPTYKGFVWKKIIR